MQFTILTQYYPPEIGAPQVRLSAFAHELKRFGHSVQVVTAMPNYPQGVIYSAYRGKFIASEILDGIPIMRTWVYAATGRNILKRLANYFSFTISCLIALAIIPRADVLFVESPPLFLCISAWLMATLRRQRLCINISDLWPDSVVELGIIQEGRFTDMAKKLERWLYQRAWRICAVTEGISETLIQKKGLNKEKLLFLPNGVDLEMFSPRSADLNLVEQFNLKGKKVFAYTGLHGYAQGLEVIIQAAAQLQQRVEIVFLLVGSGPEKLHLQEQVASLSLKNIQFLEPQPLTEMPKIFSISTACIVPLRNLKLFLGARPSKMFPPLGCAKPIIYSGAGEAASLVKSADCGLVTQPGDADELAQAILHLADHPNIAEEMGKRGRAFVEREFSWTSIVEQWLHQIATENTSKYRWPTSAVQ